MWWKNNSTQNFFENNIGRRIITINKKAKSAKKESNVANKKGDLLVPPQSITNTTKDKAITLTNNRSALVWMLVSVIALSFVVFVIDWGGTNKSPFLFATFDSFFALFAFLLIVIIRRPILFSKKILRAVIFPPQDSYRMNLLLVPCILASSAIYPFLSISTRYIDIIPVAIIYGMSPLFFVG